MKKNKKKYIKYISAILAFTVMLFLPESIGQKDEIPITTIQYDAIVKKYEMIKEVEHSDLKNIFLEIIDERLNCYENTADYSLRLENCRKEYQYQILRAARENLKSSPSLGEFMLCTQDCPLSYSFCNGEEFSGEEMVDCREIEVLCIESCLNSFWRGNSLSNTK